MISVSSIFSATQSNYSMLARPLTIYDCQKILTDISFTLFSLKNNSNHKGRIISLTQNNLFSRFKENFPPPFSNAESFSLVKLFFNALSLDFQEVVKIGEYILSDLSNLTTSLF